MTNEILIAYLRNTLHETTRQEVEAWYLASEDNQKLLEQLYFILFVNDRLQAYNQVDVNKSFLALKERMKAKTIVNRKVRYSWRIAIAAAAAVFAGMIVLNGIHMMKTLSQPFTIVTNLGERVQAILPDGSKIWVGACSKLAYYNPIPFFVSNEREVYLNGEAYFEVEKDKTHPFVVHSNDLQITVTGTRFNIRSNADDLFITTTLLEGEIKVTAAAWGDKEIVMKPNEQLRFNQETNQNEWYVCPSAKEYIGWIDGKLHFEGAPLSEIAASLERYYNVDITISSEKLRNEKFTCDFETTENIYQIFSILKLTNTFDYKINNRRIELSERCGK
jgi:ferric-dicitrate binding protein FerR (iron transport regulator)